MGKPCGFCSIRRNEVFVVATDYEVVVFYFNCVHHFFVKIRLNSIVAIKEMYVFPFCKVNSIVSCIRKSTILLFYHLYAKVFICIYLCNRIAVVGRTIINDEEFPIRICLVYNADNSCRNIFFNIICGHDY